MLEEPFSAVAEFGGMMLLEENLLRTGTPREVN